ncbi:MAG: YneF family protein [Lactovum sp.]
MSISVVILIVIIVATGAFFAGAYITRRNIEKEIEKNPILNEDAVRVIMSNMGRKPSEAQVHQTFRQIVANAKSSKDKKKK